VKKRGFKEIKRKEIINTFKRKMAFNEQQGMGSFAAAVKAQLETYQDIAYRTKAKFDGIVKQLEVHGNNYQRMKSGLTVRRGWGRGIGKGVGRGMISTIEQDPRFGKFSYTTIHEIFRGQYWALLNEHLGIFGKGFLGRQINKANLENIVHEYHGKQTGDVSAKEFAVSLSKLDDLMVDNFNAAGGALRKLTNYFPQPISATKVALTDVDEFVKDYMSFADWKQMLRDDGSEITANEREDALKAMYNTYSTDGASKIDPTQFRGFGHSIGNQLNKHRFMIFKDSDSWIAAHNKYGDGNVFEVISRHIDSMAHKTAMVQVFGRTPEVTRQNIKAIAMKIAGDAQNDPAFKDKKFKQKSARVDLEKDLQKFDAMFDVISRHNPRNPNSILGATVTSTAHTLMAAQLGSVPFIAMPGDFAQTLAVRMLNHQKLLEGTTQYVKAATTNLKEFQGVLGRSGFVSDQLVSGIYAAQRFSGFNTHVPNITSRMNDMVMRLSLNNRLTEVGRNTTRLEAMGNMYDNMKLSFKDLPDVNVYRRYGIDENDWNAFRQNITPHDANGRGAMILRPLDILGSGIKNERDIFLKFQSMLVAEGNYMVPKASVEAQVIMKDTTRSDTWGGAMLTSFAMYKNFPLTIAMINARLFLSEESSLGRLKFAAALGLGMFAVGSISTQLRELSKGRTPLPMDNPKFIIKSLIAGGGFSVWGDFIYSGTNEYGRGPDSYLAGPMGTLASDILRMTMGNGYAWVEASEKQQDYKKNIPAQLVEFSRRYAPGSSLWWARMVLEREIFDRLQEMVDPQTERKRRARLRNQRKNFGNDYYLKPGEKPITEMLTR
jgi:hypothetical protein